MPAMDPSRGRRDPAALAFDPATRRLALGGHEREVPAATGNRGVLVAYVELMARCRGDKVANLGPVRDEDVAALAEALDLGADDLEEEVRAILGTARADALRLVLPMKRSRHIGGIGRAAVAAGPADE